MISVKAKFVAILATAFMIALLAAPISAASSPGTAGTSTAYGAYAYSTSPQAPNVTLYVPFGTNNSTSLPDLIVVIYGATSFRVMDGNATVESGFSTTSVAVNMTLGNRTSNITVILDGVVYGKITNLHSTPFASLYSVEQVFIVSTYPSQSQTLYAAPNSNGALMYPYWNITIYSSAPEPYSVYVNGAFVARGTAAGVITVPVYVNGTLASAVVGLGTVVYKFTNMPISSVPLRQRYSTPSPVTKFTQAFLNDYLIKTVIAAALSLVAAILIIGRLEALKIERTVTA